MTMIRVIAANSYASIAVLDEATMQQLAAHTSHAVGGPNPQWASAISFE